MKLKDSLPSVQNCMAFRMRFFLVVWYMKTGKRTVRKVITVLQQLIIYNVMLQKKLAEGLT